MRFFSRSLLVLIVLTILFNISVLAAVSPKGPVTRVNPVALELTYKVTRFGGDKQNNVTIPVPPVEGSTYYNFVTEQVPDTANETVDIHGNRLLQMSSTSGQDVSLRFTLTLNQAAYKWASTAGKDETADPSSHAIYMLPGPMVESQAQAIISRARQAVVGENTAAGKATKIAAFVQNHLDPYQGSEEHSALWALNNGWGGSKEKARLFTALCRAIGVPARLVTGIRYPATTLNSYGTNVSYPVPTALSLWPEAYISGVGWVPMDFEAPSPVFGQLATYLLPLAYEDGPTDPGIIGGAGHLQKQITLKKLNTIGNQPPQAVITVSPDLGVTTGTDLAFSADDSTDPDGDQIVREEWENKKTRYTEGKQVVRLRVMDAKGLWSRWVEKTIMVNKPNAKPSVEIVINNKGPFTPDTKFSLSYKANDPDKDAIVDEEWLNKQESYPAGKHLVWLRVQDGRGAWSDWSKKEIEVAAPNHAPLAVIDLEPAGSINTTTHITWSSSASSDPDGDTIVDEQWQNKRETYPAGRQRVKLRVKDNRGMWSSWVEKEIEVVAGNRPPVAKITASPTQGLIAPAAVALTSQGSSDPDGDSLVNEQWENKQASYPAGTHTVKLRVQDSQGNWSAWTSTTLSVAAPAGGGSVGNAPISPAVPANTPPAAAIYAYPTENLTPETPVIWLASGSDADGDSIVAEQWENKQVYYPVGAYVVRLRVQDSRGSWSPWVEKRITVSGNRAPVAQIYMFPDYNITPTTQIHFYNGSWDPDGDSLAAEEWQNVQDFYTAGSQTVRLRVQDDRGLWSDWVEKTFVVTR